MAIVECTGPDCYICQVIADENEQIVQSSAQTPDKVLGLKQKSEQSDALGAKSAL